MDRLTYELDETAQRIGHDAASWQPSQLTIDASSVEAIEMTHDGWWVVLHIGIGEVADVFVFGPPGNRPTSLALQSVSPTAYQERQSALPPPRELSATPSRAVQQHGRGRADCCFAENQQGTRHDR
jgi:hypothetical protein